MSRVEPGPRISWADLALGGRLIVTGQIGCGKTTLARRLCERLGLEHLQIDDYHGDDDPWRSAAKAAEAISTGWVAEACVWQIPAAVWSSADLAIHLDYANRVHYLRIVRRCLRSCVTKPTWERVRDNVRGEFLHLRIMYRHADENRATWRERGGITRLPVRIIRSASPRETEGLLSGLDRAVPKPHLPGP